MNNPTAEKQSKAFDEILAIAKKAGLEILVVEDLDVHLALEGDDKAVAKLTPKALAKIKEEVVNELHNYFGDAMENAIANHIRK